MIRNRFSVGVDPHRPKSCLNRSGVAKVWWGVCQRPGGLARTPSTSGFGLDGVLPGRPKNAGYAFRYRKKTHLFCREGLGVRVDEVRIGVVVPSSLRFAAARRKPGIKVGFDGPVGGRVGAWFDPDALLPQARGGAGCARSPRARRLMRRSSFPSGNVGRGEDRLPRLSLSWPFFWWQEGQNQRPLQEKSSRHSCWQWSHRTRANPCSMSPQSRNLPTTSGRSSLWDFDPFLRNGLRLAG